MGRLFVLRFITRGRYWQDLLYVDVLIIICIVYMVAKPYLLVDEACDLDFFLMVNSDLSRERLSGLVFMHT